MKAFDDYKVKVLIPISWSEMDALGHVNNTNYFRYYDHARSQYLLKLGCYELFSELGIQMVIKSINCQFISPIQFPDTITVGTRVSFIKEDYCVMEHFISTDSLGLVSFSEVELNMISTASSKKVDIPLRISLLVKEFEKL